MPIARFLMLALGVSLAAGAAPAGAGTAAQERPEALLDRGSRELLDGRFAQALADFDTLIKQVPEAAPQLWQRGIALYYAGRYRECRAQFELHRTVNPDDVENAAWHYLCVARAESPERARRALLPVGPDSRVPMREVYEMFRGVLAPDRVIAAAGRSDAGVFLAHLYAGMYFDAQGDRTRALEHLRVAAQDRYAPAGGYMHGVARVHLATLQRAK